MNILRVGQNSLKSWQFSAQLATSLLAALEIETTLLHYVEVVR